MNARSTKVTMTSFGPGTRAGLIALTLASAYLQGCSTAAEHYQQLGATQDRALTVGIVQKDIVKGLPASSVASRLGSPNIVTRDVDGKETWIYDKVATEASFSQGTGNFGAGLFGNAYFPGINSGSLSAATSGNVSKSTGAANVTQRTLTVVIKFDPGQQVESVNYHSTKF